MKNINYKDVFTLKKYITKRGKIVSRERTKLSAKEQRKLSVEVKRARFMALLPFINRE
jgi:small subunit ribosomal protein S18